MFGTMKFMVTFILFFSFFECAPFRKSFTQNGYNTKSLTCDACEVLIDILQKFKDGKISGDVAKDIAIATCDVKGIEDHYICKGVVSEFKDEILTIVSQSRFLVKGNYKICEWLLDLQCGKSFNDTWNITIPPGKPPVKPYPPPPKKGAPVDRILHVTDIHWDPQYTEGLDTECSEPLCCRPPNKKGSGDRAAGAWGNPHCDIPYRTVINMMEYLHKISDKIDWVYMTGDLPAHNDWSQTRDDQLNVLANITRLFGEYLPDIPVYFAIGNHESAPVNSFPPPFITGDESEAWLYDKAADVWGDWIGPDAVETLKYGGYYASNIRRDLKVISLQTNFCSKMNWWLLLNTTDPAGMLNWLGNELLDSEREGQKVHIIGHIPSNNSPCLHSWSNAFHELVYRFENTITGYFYGHTHDDNYYVFRAHNENPQRPFGVAYVAPSVTSYQYDTAAFRIYDLDGSYNGSNRTILDHYTYIMNVTDANLGNEPKWELEYSAKDAYNLSSLSPESWNNLIDTFNKDDDLFQKFNKYVSKSSSTNLCTSKCKRDRLRYLSRDISSTSETSRLSGMQRTVSSTDEFLYRQC